jgi:hypothetical protein
MRDYAKRRKHVICAILMCQLKTLGVVVMQEIVEVEIEDVSQLDDSAANF